MIPNESSKQIITASGGVSLFDINGLCSIWGPAATTWQLLQVHCKFLLRTRVSWARARFITQGETNKARCSRKRTQSRQLTHRTRTCWARTIWVQAALRSGSKLTTPRSYQVDQDTMVQELQSLKTTPSITESSPSKDPSHKWEATKERWLRKTAC